MPEEIRRYSLEEAQSEAARLQSKVASGGAKDFKEAEVLVHRENEQVEYAMYQHKLLRRRCSGVSNARLSTTRRHPLHIFFSAIVISAILLKYKSKAWKAFIFGVIGAVIIGNLSGNGTPKPFTFQEPELMLRF